ncbi:amino acid aminotransferase [uncultured Alsobacter sp.]|uniref:amino acid aminotransferase n=1 Tax=uncultured Alsobacter sp. TaxID=1748258 RepID=UPI0025EAC528|nr:amino acid aminotransferase [uncultured Alsobacter sp.]
MLDHLQMPPPDKILSLMAMFREDPRPEKMDLGVGVYRDASGTTPILAAVKEAERRVLAAETTKTYLGPAGDPVFCDLVADLVFGAGRPKDRLRGVQTTGGGGALSVLAGLVAAARPGATVHVPDPTWVNHGSILRDNGLSISAYPYLARGHRGIDFDGLIGHLGAVPAGDVVLVHGCCHNPSGTDLTRDQWQRLAALLAERGLMPFVDLAYLGFGDGLEEDAFAVRLLAAIVPEMVVAVSCSKNFGIYRERTGAAFALARTADEAAVAREHMTVRNRILYSMPPDHGSAIVRTVLSDAALAAQWRAELDAMRTGVQSLRDALAAAFARLTNRDDHGFLATDKGMFSMVGITPEQVRRLREEHAIYMVEDSRINVAGLRHDQVERFARAVLATTA